MLSLKSFNTQPPEGGWLRRLNSCRAGFRFNTQPPEGGWKLFCFGFASHLCFNTQPPEGGWPNIHVIYGMTFRFQHTAARRRLEQLEYPVACISGGFNTQPPEGGWGRASPSGSKRASFNTQPPEGGWDLWLVYKEWCRQFQHTAARRRLDSTIN